MAIRHNGTAFIDIISPCIAYANHEGSTRSFEAVRAANVSLQELGFVQPVAEIKIDYPEGEAKTVELHDGSRVILRKLKSEHHDITKREAALRALGEARARHEFLTGLFYWDQSSVPLAEQLKLVSTPLRDLAEKTRPGVNALDEILARFE